LARRIVEHWAGITKFELYSVSDQGRVRNNNTGQILRTGKNQARFVTVTLYRDGARFLRSVSQLVATEFVTKPKMPDSDTVIHLNYDRDYNVPENLAWRPRWYAIEYNLQPIRPLLGLPGPIVDLQSGEVYAHTSEISMRYGVLMRYIDNAIFEDDWVHIINRRFKRTSY
jgi:hypothetical protein